MIIVAWIIVGLFAGLIALVVFCDWRFSLTIAGIILAFCLVSWAVDYISHHQQAESPTLPTTDAIAQALTNWMGVPVTTWGTNDETLQLGLAPNGLVVWRRVDTNIWANLGFHHEK